DLNGAQKATIEGAMKSLEGARPERGERGERGAPFAGVAGLIRAGSADAAAFQAQLAEGRPDHATGHQARREATTSALKTLHATLTREQRRALVDELTARFDEKEQRFAERAGAKGADGAK